MRVLFLPRYGRLAGSSRYMSYDYLPYYEKNGISCTIKPILDDVYLLRRQAIQRGEGEGVDDFFRHALHMLRLFITRFLYILKAGHFDVVVLEKDVVPYFPYLMDALLFRLNKRVIVMYDESTYSFYAKHPDRVIRALNKGKIDRIIQNAAHVIVWNSEMRVYVEKLNPNVTAVTTGIDLNRYEQKAFSFKDKNPIKIGWIGTPSGFAYLHMLDGVIKKIANNYPIELYVVSSEPYEVDGVPTINRRWSVETEVDHLQNMDIGVMPLPQSDWASGKSGCKMLQYMGVGLPVVVSPVGINNEVVEDGVNGFTAVSEDDWYRQLVRLIESPELRQQLGAKGREYVEKNNDQRIIAHRLLEVIQSVSS